MKRIIIFCALFILAAALIYLGTVQGDWANARLEASSL